MIKITFYNFIITGLLTLLSLNSYASVITTTMASNNGQSGNMFDVVNLGNDQIVTGFDLNLDIGTYNVEVYTHAGSWLGFESTASAWDLVSTGSVTSTAADSASFFDVSDFILSGLSTTGLYITLTNGTAMNYTNGTSVGNVYAENSDLQILEGAGVAYAFSSTYTSRVWNGSIYYQASTSVASSVSVPEPSLLALMGLGLMGFLATKNRNKN